MPTRIYIYTGPAAAALDDRRLEPTDLLAEAEAVRHTRSETPRTTGRVQAVPACAL